MQLTRPKLVYVTWKDCTSCDAWMLPPDLEEFGCQMIHTCGFLTLENDEFIGVSVAWEESFGKVAGTFLIPRAQLINVEEFEFVN